MTHDRAIALADALLVLSSATEEGALASSQAEAAAEVVYEYLYEVDADLASAGFLRLLQALRSRASGGIRNPEAYLRVILRNVKIDELRRAKRISLLAERMVSEALPLGDQDAELERIFAELHVGSLQQKLASVEEVELLKFVSSWLDLADELGRRPSSREASKFLGVSHQTVENRLAALRAFVGDRD